MKFTCDQIVFSKALGIVSKAISGNTTLPVLENILIKAEGGVVRLTATNLEISISTYFEATVEEEGDMTLPAKILVSYVNLLSPDVPIMVRTDEGVSVSISALRAQTKIKGIPAEDFPIIPTVEAEHMLHLERQQFLDSLESVVFSTSSNTTRPILSGVLFKVQKEALVLASTDSFRLSEKTHVEPGLQTEKEHAIIVPARTLLEMMRIFPKDGENMGYIQVHVGHNQVMFEAGETKIISRLIEGVYPDYAQIIPKESTTVAKIPVGAFGQMMKRMNLFAKENNFHVKFALHPEKKELEIYTDSVETGEDRGILALDEISGPEVTVSLNATFVLDALAHMHTEEISVYLMDALKPVIFRRMTKQGVDDTYMHLIMPLKG